MGGLTLFWDGVGLPFSHVRRLRHWAFPDFSFCGGGEELNDIGTDSNFGYSEKYPISGAWLDDEMRDGLGLPFPHLGRAIHASHGFGQCRRNNRDYTQQAESLAHAG